MCASWSEISARASRSTAPRCCPRWTARSSPRKIFRRPRRPCRDGAGLRYRSKCGACRVFKRHIDRIARRSRLVEGMTRSSPIRRLTSVDLPTFGRPTIAIFGPPSWGSSSFGSGNGASTFDQLADAFAMRGRDCHRMAQAKLVKFRHDHVFHHTFGLVHRQRNGNVARSRNAPLTSRR